MSDEETNRIHIDYLRAALDEIRRDDFPQIQATLKEEIHKEFGVISSRLNDIYLEVEKLKTQTAWIDKRVWVMFGIGGLLIPPVLGMISMLFFAWLTGQFE